jgi:hypothetical protein
MKYKKQIQLIAAIVTLIVFPVITFYLMEAYTHNPFEEVRPWAQFFNILLFELLAWIFQMWMWIWNFYCRQKYSFMLPLPSVLSTIVH